MSKLTCTGNVQGSEHSVLIHGTKLLPDLDYVCGVNEGAVFSKACNCQRVKRVSGNYCSCEFEEFSLIELVSRYHLLLLRLPFSRFLNVTGVSTINFICL